MSGWERAREAAVALAPASAWRRELAAALSEVDGVVIVGVFTCPPGQLLEVACAIAPESRAQTAHQLFVERFLPRIDGGGDWTTQAKALGCSAYDPMERRGGGPRIDRVLKNLLLPMGARGLLNVFLLDASDEVIGWVAAGTAQSSAEALEEVGSELTEVARLATGTLRAALDLALACGAVVSPTTRSLLSALSVREREVLLLVAAGLSDVSIAARLGITENTVGTHLRRIYTKLSVHSRVELVTLASAWASAADEG